MKRSLLLSVNKLLLFFACGAIFALFPFTLQMHNARADSPSFVRIIHASPDVGSADVFVDGQHLLSNFQFGTVTPYVTLSPGPHYVQVALIGRGPGAAAINQNIIVNSGDVYTVAALGTKALGFKLDVFNDDNQVATGMAKMRVYDLSPDTALQGITTNNNQVCGEMSYQDASDYIPLQSGAYNFNISTAQSNTSIPFSTTLNQNAITSVFAIGESNGTPKLEFVSTNVSGVPGMPGTGSDPNAPDPEAPQWGSLWPVAVMILGLLATSGVAINRRLTARKA
jgi:Domain of unknown function (DUF4397)